MKVLCKHKGYKSLTNSEIKGVFLQLSVFPNGSMTHNRDVELLSSTSEVLMLCHSQ